MTLFHWQSGMESKGLSVSLINKPHPMFGDKGTEVTLGEGHILGLHGDMAYLQIESTL